METNLFDITDNGLKKETTIAGVMKIARKEIGSLQLPGVSLTVMDQIGGTSLEAEGVKMGSDVSFILTNDKGESVEAGFNTTDVRLFAELLLQLCAYQDACGLDGRDEGSES